MTVAPLSVVIKKYPPYVEVGRLFLFVKTPPILLQDGGFFGNAYAFFLA